MGQEERRQAEHLKRQRLIAAGRLFDLENIQHGFDTKDAVGKVLIKHRESMRTLWKEGRADDVPQDDAGASEDARRAALELQRLREKAERLYEDKDQVIISSFQITGYSMSR